MAVCDIFVPNRSWDEEALGVIISPFVPCHLDDEIDPTASSSFSDFLLHQSIKEEVPSLSHISGSGDLEIYRRQPPPLPTITKTPSSNIWPLKIEFPHCPVATEEVDKSLSTSMTLSYPVTPTDEGDILDNEETELIPFIEPEELEQMVSEWYRQKKRQAQLEAEWSEWKKKYISLPTRRVPSCTSPKQVRDTIRRRRARASQNWTNKYL